MPCTRPNAAHPAGRQSCRTLLCPKATPTHTLHLECKGFRLRGAAQVHEVCHHHLAVQQLVQNHAKAGQREGEG